MSLISNSYKEALSQSPEINPDTIDYGLNPSFKVTTKKFCNLERTVETFVMPNSETNSALAFAEFTVTPIGNKKEVPVPYEDYKYTMRNFESTFLADLITFSELNTFMAQVSQRMTESSKEAEIGPLILRVALSIILFTFCFVGSGLSYILALSEPTKAFLWVLGSFCLVLSLFGFFLYKLTVRRKMRLVSSFAYQDLVLIIHEEKHQLLSKGVLARPGSFGAFIQFVPSDF